MQINKRIMWIRQFKPRLWFKGKLKIIYLFFQQARRGLVHTIDINGNFRKRYKHGDKQTDNLQFCFRSNQTQTKLRKQVDLYTTTLL